MLVTKLSLEKLNLLDLNFKLFKSFVTNSIKSLEIKRAPKKGLGFRVRTVSKRHVRSSMFTATYNLVSRVRLQLILE